MDLVRELTPLTPEIALPLYVAISTDTGGFIYSNVTAATHRAAAELMDTGIDYRAVNKLFFQTKSRVRMQLEAAMLAEAKFYDNNRTAVLSVPRSLLEKFHATESDAEDLSALGPQIQGVDCAVTMRELGDGVWKFSLRTGERVNATEVCRLLGGGGHAAPRSHAGGRYPGGGRRKNAERHRPDRPGFQEMRNRLWPAAL